MSSFIQQHASLLLTLALLGASLFAVPIAREGYRMLRALRVRVRSRAARAAIDALTAVAAAAVAAAAEEVRNLKDPSKPGTWTHEAAMRILERVIGQVMHLGAEFIEQLKALGVVDAESVYSLIEKLVEQQVERLRRLGPVATELRAEDFAELAPPFASAGKTLSPYRGATLITPSVPPAPPPAPSADLSRASVAPAPHDRRAGSQGGFARITSLALLLFIILVPALLAIVGCTPQPVPPSDGGPVVVTPSSWVRTARLSITVGRGLIIPARAIVEATVSEPGLTRARRGFDVSDRALGGLDLALTAYESRGGDACAVYAAAGAAAIALQELAQILVEEGFAFGRPLGQVLDMVASVVDTLVPRCDAADAGFRSAGRAANTIITEFERAARLRGVILRRDLDRIAPELDAGVQ